MDLNFEIFMVVLLVLAILVVGNFLRDGPSNYLEGALLIVGVSNPLTRPLTRSNVRPIIARDPTINDFALQ
jgi:hypothetical protein